MKNEVISGYVKIPLAQAKSIMEYLSARPYKEVAAGISWIATSIRQAEDQDAAAHSKGTSKEPTETYPEAAKAEA